ncbi:MAG: hypothetical protein RBR74_06705 [Ignavibacteriaceae bacterium]|jgi:hypothetical protein|nr:hypothetical protein [Ignavibacteriaceae bacterium]
MIFGVNAPQFIYDPTGVNETVLLDYIIPLRDEAEQEILIHQSIFTGHREFIQKGFHWIYECKLHLFKYDNPLLKYEELKQYEGLLVRFYRHRDGDYLKDSTGAEVEMFLESVDESYYQTTDYKDLLLLKFKSSNYVDLAKNLES